MKQSDSAWEPQSPRGRPRAFLCAKAGTGNSAMPSPPALVHLVNRRIQRRRAGRQANHFQPVKPGRIDIRRRLNVKRRHTVFPAAGHQFAGVVGVAAADHDHGLHLVQQVSNAFWWSLVGWQTVSMKRTSASGFFWATASRIC